ncbi:XdhC family protein [Natronorubrum bangense]|uniref:YHS domain-containing protein n=2 Tax=Natronorubrum bangense TaxID=61858 RepID=A0A4D6HJB8_9EURY|nr:XdhC family protein [Natronorubrum bangense]ELY43204.1 xanthine dehydrogenase accessory factor, putative subfamily, putative [Natronorubrum bangense JCM 10635]QCC53296.1 YHS domain-containing protein [Natronorubrum bangense]QCC56010.1 YHS domain-containing protein [Natronorubrum bangense]
MTPDTASDADLAAHEQALQAREEPYAWATVVRREPPVSATVGDRALVTADGELHGWIGGVSCAQSRVTSEARAAIADGEPRLIGIAPDPDVIDRPGLEAFPMQCHSQGTLEVFIDPVCPATRLLVVGGSPIAHSLVRLASELDIEVVLVDPDGADADLPSETTVLTTLEPDEIAEAVGSGPLVAIASMGEYDAHGVVAGIRTGAPYIGLVASETRAAETVDHVAGLLEEAPDTVRDAVTSPAGVDISASSAPEIATSLLAELVEVRSTTSGVAASNELATHTDASNASNADTAESSELATETASCCGGGDERPSTTEPESSHESAVDPVCGMTVDPDEAPSITHQGTTYYFCCHGCADAFRTDPDEYLEGPTTETMNSV